MTGLFAALVLPELGILLVPNADQRPTDFWKVGFNDKGWDNMQVPAVWELNGYGDPIYVNTGYAWRNQFQNNPPEVPTQNNHVGSYRREIIDRIPLVRRHISGRPGLLPLQWRRTRLLSVCPQQKTHSGHPCDARFG